MNNSDIGIEINRIENKAYQFCLDNKVERRNDKSFNTNNKELIKVFLSNKNKQSTRKTLHLSALLLEWYSTIPIEHDHHNDGGLNLDSIKYPWAREAIIILTIEIESTWDKLNQENN